MTGLALIGLTGSRAWPDVPLLETALYLVWHDALELGYTGIELMHGCADGADTIGGTWANRNGILVRERPADWDGPCVVESLRKGVRVDDAVFGAMLTDVRSRRPAPKGKTALRIAAVAGANTGKPWVTIARGSQSGQLAPDEARDMAVHWIQTAVAAQIDVRTRYALGEWDRLDVVEIEELFTLIQKAGR